MPANFNDGMAEGWGSVGRPAMHIAIAQYGDRVPTEIPFLLVKQ